MIREQHNALPDTLTLREVQYRVTQKKGFRTSLITVVTTLLDHRKYPAKEIADLYFKRWSIETNIIYNLVRLVMLKAAQKQKVPPDRISFTDALRWLISAERGSRLTNLLVVPHRPGRSRPRIKKRHEKGFDYKFKTKREKKQEWTQQKEERKQILKGLS